MSNRIIPFDSRPVAGNYEIPENNNSRLSERTVQSIINAWNRLTVIDNYGRPWTRSDGIHVVLRTSPDNAAYLIAGLPDEQKYRTGDYLYIRGDGICYLLDSSILNSREILRENYIRYSQLLYIAIRDCSRARELRAEHYAHVQRTIRTLKRRRITDYGIQADELTGAPLVTSEFSHIRSVSIFPNLAAHIDNGLIVNEETHRIITSNSINDENELLALCDTQGWDTSWYHGYMAYLTEIGEA